MYLEGKIKGDGESVKIQCLESGCDRIVSEKVVDELMPAELKERSVLSRSIGDGGLAWELTIFCLDLAQVSRAAEPDIRRGQPHPPILPRARV